MVTIAGIKMLTGSIMYVISVSLIGITNIDSNRRSILIIVLVISIINLYIYTYRYQKS